MNSLLGRHEFVVTPYLVPILILLLAAADGCTLLPHRFSNEEVTRCWSENRRLFEDVAERWQADNPSGSLSFTQADAGILYWNGIRLKPAGLEWELSYAGLSYKVPLERAARVLRIRVERLAFWMKLSRELPVEEIRAINDMGPAGQSPVEILFRGSSSVLAGVIFVPESDEAIYRKWLGSEASAQPTYRRVELIRDRWFYFEALRLNRGAITMGNPLRIGTEGVLAKAFNH